MGVLGQGGHSRETQGLRAQSAPGGGSGGCWWGLRAGEVLGFQKGDGVCVKGGLGVERGDEVDMVKG